jgi:hypothetical protein
MTAVGSHSKMAGLCCPILGMHRSGTSCLARILNRAGVAMAGNLIVEARFDNLLGHWEPEEMIRVNDRILAASGGAWNCVPAELVVETEVKHEIAAFLEQFQDAAVFGWKDPRLTITLPAWRAFLSKYQLVACVRHPHAVANSLVARDDMNFQAAVDLWVDYNERLLLYADESPDIFWFQYDGPRQQYAHSLRSFCDVAGLPYSDDLLELYNPCFTHHDGTVEVADMRARATYRRLIDVINEAFQRRSEAASSRPADVSPRAAHEPKSAAEGPQPATPDFEPTGKDRIRINQVVESLRAINLQQQRDQKAIGKALGQIHSHYGEIHALEQEIARLAEKVQSLTAQIRRVELSEEAIHRWFLLRAYCAIRTRLLRLVALIGQRRSSTRSEQKAA